MKTLEYYLDVIAKSDGNVRAWAYHEPSEVKAQEVDALAGVLRGLPVGLKDIIDTKDMPTCYGSAAYANFYPKANAWVVERLQAAGAILMGKTVTAEFAFAHPGPTRNPHNLAFTPGGSSSGSAAAVAADMVPVAIGSQTGGSTIRPSAYCGVVGFKPTFGLISLQGVLALAPSLDTIGIHSQSVALASKVFGVLSQRGTAGDEKCSVLRVGWYLGPGSEHAQPQYLDVLRRVREMLEKSGLAVVTGLPMPDETYDAISKAHRHIMAREASRIHKSVYERTPSMLGVETVSLIETGLGIPTSLYTHALDEVAKGKVVFASMMHDFDVVITLSASGEAPRFEDGMGDSAFNRVWTALGVPCVTLPAGTGVEGLPLAVQLVGAYGDDERLLNFARKVETLLARVPIGG